jgi:hypothetical protein
VLLDAAHVVAERFGTRNVPAGVWIDEAGRIVRPAEVAQARVRPAPGAEPVPHGRYLNALRDWVAHGAQSVYVRQAAGTPGPAPAEAGGPAGAEAIALFRLGVYLSEQGYGAAAGPYFKRAIALRPDDWNTRRQAWNLGDIARDYGTTFQEEVREVGPPNAPLVMPDPPPG